MWLATAVVDVWRVVLVVDLAGEVVLDVDVVIIEDVLLVEVTLACGGTASMFGRGIVQLSFSDPRPCGMASTVHCRRPRTIVRREIGL